MDVGNAHDAALIYRWLYESEREYGRSQRVWDAKAPDGWEFLGSGSFRSVWRSPEGVAYKVQHTSRTSQSNEGEYRTLQEARLCKLPERVRLPLASLFEVDNCFVIAMELIRGPRLYDYQGADQSDLMEILYEVEVTLEMGDLHSENAMVDEDGMLVPVDFGC
jgi:RIO-like serine/threonine protein kinase